MPDNTLKTYRRLLSFARPYWFRLAVGLVCGIVAGGSWIGVFRYAPRLIEPFEHAAAAQAAHGDDQPAAIQPQSTPAPESVPGNTDDHTAENAHALPIEVTALDSALLDKFDISVTRPDGTMTWQFMLLSIIGLPVFMGLRALAMFINRYYMRWVGSRVVLDLRNRLFENLQNQSLKFFGSCDIGDLISHITNDAAMVEYGIAQTIADLSQAPVVILVALGTIIHTALTKDWSMALFGMFILVPLMLTPIIVLGRHIKRYTRAALRRVSNLVSRMQENFTGIRVVKAFHTEAQELERFKAMNEGYFKNIIRALRAELFMTPLIEFLGVAAACVGLVVCRANGIMFSDILPLGLAAWVAYKPIKQLAKMNVSIQRSAAAADRLFTILDTDTSLPEKTDAKIVESFTDRISFENVEFSYKPEDPPVLRDISLDLQRGHTVAFVGETGSGKTTVANLLARFYDPTAGAVLLDGTDLRDIKISSLRHLVGVVTQETILFNDTIANNIAYGQPEATREEIIEAAKQANAHEFIMANPGGYDRIVGEKGFVLSGGQRQRVAIARAILRNPPILILDEATSALDTVTEQLVQQALLRLMENRTVFAIAHRLSTIKHADLICVLDHGKVIERGTHQQLYEANGTYRHLCDIQFS
jgi:subfamily B ATP-binding cassette protein MsbA